MLTTIFFFFFFWLNLECIVFAYNYPANLHESNPAIWKSVSFPSYKYFGLNQLKRPFGKRISITLHLICMQRSPQEGRSSSVVVFPLHFKGHHITNNL